MKVDEVTNPFNDFYEDVTPVADNILVEVVKDETDAVSAGGIILSTARNVSMFARVVAVGPLVTIGVKPKDMLEFGDGMVIPNVVNAEKKATQALINQNVVVGVRRCKVIV